MQLPLRFSGSCFSYIWPRITASVQHHIAMQHVQMWLQQAQRPDVNLPFLSGSGAATAATRASVLFTGWAVVASCVSTRD